MAKLFYITNASLDGYLEDPTGAFDSENPDQVFDFSTRIRRITSAAMPKKCARLCQSTLR